MSGTSSIRRRNILSGRRSTSLSGTRSGLSGSRERIGTFRRPGAHSSFGHGDRGSLFGRIGGTRYGRYPYHRYGYRGYYGYYPYRYRHKNSIFISIGGYWPWWYVDWPWYWYGYYPYYWYQPYPYGYWIGPGVSNYYYYNYETPAPDSDTGYEIQEPNYEAFRRARERLEKQEQKTAEQPKTQTDVDFDEGIKAFEQGDYGVAAAKFANAAQSAPEDIVLPFAYSQALLAAKEYHKAAEVLRGAIGRLRLEEEGVFYPRGLYSSDTELEKQISELADTANANPTDYDLQLLVGYQNLGMNRLDEARKYLEGAKGDAVNGPAAQSLLALIEKLESEPEK